MRQAFVYEAVLSMDPEADTRAPGAAVTQALCGHWEHPPPCPLAPHHSSVEREGDRLRVRVLFVAEPGMKAVVHERIEGALAGGRLVGPDGVATTWKLRSGRPSRVTEPERLRAARLAGPETGTP
jgi:hypothetical protein